MAAKLAAVERAVGKGTDGALSERLSGLQKRISSMEVPELDALSRRIRSVLAELVTPPPPPPLPVLQSVPCRPWPLCRSPRRRCCQVLHEQQKRATEGAPPSEETVGKVNELAALEQAGAAVYVLCPPEKTPHRAPPLRHHPARPSRRCRSWRQSCRLPMRTTSRPPTPWSDTTTLPALPPESRFPAVKPAPSFQERLSVLTQQTEAVNAMLKMDQEGLEVLPFLPSSSLALDETVSVREVRSPTGCTRAPPV